jgi:1,4-alpha-glucan branching enzyme
MWLPECAYRPATAALNGPAETPARSGLESVLAAHDLKYFFIDGDHLARRSSPAGYGDLLDTRLDLGRERAAGRMYLPYVQGACETPEEIAAGVDRDRAAASPDLYRIYRTGEPSSGEAAFFARDTATSQQVWSAQWGYPGDPFYLEFHKKHSPGGLRYWRVTDHAGDLGTKLVYEPGQARQRVEEHARHFAHLVQGRLRRYHRETGNRGVLTLMFDAELFGHWWFEGIPWLGALVSGFDENYVKIEKASAALAYSEPPSTTSLPEGSWGEGGHHLIWYNNETAWTWRYLHEVERDMERALAAVPDGGISGRLLRQMAREIFLLQSSDWQFLISTKTAADYGRSRFLGHYRAYMDLSRMADRFRLTGSLTEADRRRLRALEERDCLFDDVNLEWFRERTSDGL